MPKFLLPVFFGFAAVPRDVAAFVAIVGLVRD